MNQEKISIIIPVHNATAYIDRCLESITKQTYSNLEIIIVENGSTDDSFCFCERWAQKDSRIELFSLEKGNVSIARNYALSKVSGNYYMFVDVDDFLELSACEKMLNSALQNKSDLVFCQLCNVTRNGEKILAVESEIKSLMNDNRVDYWFNNDIRHGVWRILFLTKKFIDIRFDELMNLHEDHLYFFKMKMLADTCSFVDEPLYFYNYNYDLNNYQAKKYYNSNSILIFEKYAKGIQEFFEHYDLHEMACAYSFGALTELEHMLIINEKKYKRIIKQMLKTPFWKEINTQKNYKLYISVSHLSTKKRILIFLLKRRLLSIYRFIKSR